MKLGSDPYSFTILKSFINAVFQLEIFRFVAQNGLWNASEIHFLAKVDLHLNLFCST